jgi:preprotein translocase subunit SecE
MKKMLNAIGKYFKGVGKEVKRIRWTTKSDLVKYSISTVAMMIVFGIFFYGVDIIVSVLRSLI